MMDCTRICFRSNTHMEIVEAEAFVIALVEIIDRSAVLINNTARGLGRASLVDVAVRCVCNGSFQNAAFATLIHSSRIVQAIIAVCPKY